MKIISGIFRPLPRLLYLEPVFGCNYRCFFCVHGGGRKVKPVQMTPMVFERLKPIVDRATHIHVTGMGEPFLNEHLEKYLAFFREKGKKYYINTNGSLIQDAHARLLLTSTSELSISLDAADKETYQKVRHPGKWDKVVGMIKRISDLKVKQASRYPLLYLSYHINWLNLSSLRYLSDLCRELRINAVKLSWTILPDTHKTLSPFEDLVEAAAFIRSVGATLRGQGVEIRDEVLFQPHERGCWDLTDFAFIGANGMVAACCNRWLSIGDLMANRFEDIWNGEPHRKIFFGVLNHRPVASCKTCRQLQTVDYRKNAGAFKKDPHSDDALLAEKRRVVEELPSLGNLDEKFAEGLNALIHKDIEKALNIYTALARAYPSYYEIKNNLAVACLLNGQSEKSKRLFEHIQTIPYNQAIVSYNRHYLQGIL